MRIMYVEDNPANVFLIRRVAKEGNHEVFSFIDGVEALEKFEEVNPDLVLMDIQLSGELNGLEVVRRLRAAGHEVPIIAVTAYAMVGDKERCLEAGCTDYVAKPLPVAQLVEMFRQYTRKHLETQELLRLQAEQAAAAQSQGRTPAASQDDTPKAIVEVEDTPKAIVEAKEKGADVTVHENGTSSS